MTLYLKLSLVEIRAIVMSCHILRLYNVFLTIELQGVVVAFAEELGFTEAKLFPWS